MNRKKKDKKEITDFSTIQVSLLRFVHSKGGAKPCQKLIYAYRFATKKKFCCVEKVFKSKFLKASKNKKNKIK